MLKSLLAILLSITVTSALRADPTVIHNNTAKLVQKATDLGPVDPSTVIGATVWLKLHNESHLDTLVKQQHDKNSANYHKWITQDQFNANYGPTAQELNSVQNFLAAQGLKVIATAENNAFVKVQGTVGAMQKAFHVQIDRFKLNGKIYRSNKNDPSIDNIAAPHIAAITGLDDYGFQPAIARPSDPNGKPAPFVPLSKVGPKGVFFEGHAFRPPETHTFTGGGNTATYTGNRYGADITNTALGHLPPQGYSPDEVQTAYKLKPLYAGGLNGAGQSIVIVDAFGSKTIADDAAVFSQIYGLPPINLEIVKAPGLSNNPHGAGWDSETTLDVEWAHAIAPRAKIVLVVADNHASLDEAINYAVIHHLGNTISNSWSIVEGFGNPAQYGRDNRILQMAAAQGIDVNFSSGDNGDESLNVGFVTVDFPASSPYATGIGGTSLALNNDNTIKFQEGWGTNETLIVNPSPSGGQVADDGPPVVPPVNFGFVFGAGGGTSLTFPKPEFQSSLPGNKRLVPDISMIADPFTGVEIIQTIDGQLSVGVIGGTSLACPVFSGVMAIAAQKAGHGLGQAAALVYDLPAGAVTDIVPVGSPFNVTGVINGNAISADALAQPLYNTTTYFSALYNSPFSTRWFVLTFGTDTSLTVTPGWDNVTGVGTPNGANFVDAIAQ